MNNDDIANSLLDISKVLSQTHDRYKYLWDRLMEDEDGISGETYGALVDLGNIICPYFVKGASQRMELSDNRWYPIGRDYA
jgi:hypothetical protein